MLLDRALGTQLSAAMHRPALSPTLQAKLKRRAFQQRPIQHPRFANLSAAAARAALANADGAWAGQDKFLREVRHDGARDADAIFHPSSKGSDRLSLSMRLFTASGGHPVIQNVDVLETKSNRGAGGHLTLGTPLKIEVFQYHGALEFEDLDEVLARFVAPYAARFADVRRHRKFVDATVVRSTLFAPCCFKRLQSFRMAAVSVSCFRAWCQLRGFTLPHADCLHVHL